MEFLEETMVFENPRSQHLAERMIASSSERVRSRSAHSDGREALEYVPDTRGIDETEVEIEDSIRMRLANAPVSYDLQKLLTASGKKIPSEFQTIYDNHDVYSVAHSIGVTRERGSGKILQLMYNAEMISPDKTHTIDLVPDTSFGQFAKFGDKTNLSLSANGVIAAEIPESLTNSLLPAPFELGGGVKIQLSTEPSFVGQIEWVWKYPISQASGKNATYCNWILEGNEEKNPMLGDQVLVQIIAVPKGTKEVSYKVWGSIRVKPSWLANNIEKRTKESTIIVELS